MLRDDIDLNEFFLAVERCEGEVLFLSSQGSRIDLRSALCQYLFSSVYLSKELQLEGEILCARAEDMEHLAPFLNT